MNGWKRILNLILFAIFAFLLIKLTTFGWRASPTYPPELSPQEQQSVKHLRDIVLYVSSEIGNRNYVSYDNLNRAADFIIQQLDQLGYVADIMTYQIKGQEHRNIIAEIPGVNHKENTIIVGAHYDSCFNPGADDNASGIAGLLELARSLKDTALKANIRFIAFTNEEPPFFMSELMGSRVYAKKAKENNENIKAVIILEMLGYYSEKTNSQRYLPFLGMFYPNRADFIAVVGNFPSRKIVSKITAASKDYGRFPVEGLVAPSFVPGVNFSDHWSFWKEGFSAVMITDTAFLRNPHYHLESDLPDTINYEKLALAIQTIKNSIIKLANE